MGEHSSVAAIFSILKMVVKGATVEVVSLISIGMMGSQHETYQEWSFHIKNKVRAITTINQSVRMGISDLKKSVVVAS